MAKAAEAKTGVGASDIAKKLKVEPSAFRRWLRNNGKNTEGEYARYTFTDAQAEKIMGDYRKSQEKAEKNGGSKKAGASKKGKKNEESAVEEVA